MNDYALAMLGAMGASRIPISVQREMYREFDLEVDDSLDLFKMIELGKYGWVDSNIVPARFPFEAGVGKREIRARFEYYHGVSTDVALAHFKSKGLYPAGIRELLALGKAHPLWQTRFPIVALGSSCEIDGKLKFTCLGGKDEERRLILEPSYDLWPKVFLFLAVYGS